MAEKKLIKSRVIDEAHEGVLADERSKSLAIIGITRASIMSRYNTRLSPASSYDSSVEGLMGKLGISYSYRKAVESLIRSLGLPLPTPLQGAKRTQQIEEWKERQASIEAVNKKKLEQEGK